MEVARRKCVGVDDNCSMTQACAGDNRYRRTIIGARARLRGMSALLTERRYKDGTVTNPVTKRRQLEWCVNESSGPFEVRVLFPGQKLVDNWHRTL